MAMRMDATRVGRHRVVIRWLHDRSPGRALRGPPVYHLYCDSEWPVDLNRDNLVTERPRFAGALVDMAANEGRTHYVLVPPENGRNATPVSRVVVPTHGEGAVRRNAHALRAPVGSDHV